LPCWTHDGDPTEVLQINTQVNWFKSQLRENPHFLQDLVTKYFKVICRRIVMYEQLVACLIARCYRMLCLTFVLLRHIKIDKMISAWSVMQVGCAETAERIDVLFWGGDSWELEKRCVSWGVPIPHGTRFSETFASLLWPYYYHNFYTGWTKLNAAIHFNSL